MAGLKFSQRCCWWLTLLGLFDPEHDDITFLRNVCNYRNIPENVKVGVYSYWQARGIWRIPDRRGTSAHSPVTGSITRVRPPAETQHTQQFWGVHNVLSSDCCHARNTNQASHLLPATVHYTSPRDSAYMKLWKLLDFAISEASPAAVLKIQSLALLHAAQIWPINDTAAKYWFCKNTAEPQVIRAHTSKQLFQFSLSPGRTGVLCLATSVIPPTLQTHVITVSSMCRCNSALWGRKSNGPHLTSSPSAAKQLEFRTGNRQNNADKQMTVLKTFLCQLYVNFSPFNITENQWH
jgi:hypothetical protein